MLIFVQESGGGSAVSSLLFFAVLLVGLYLLLIRPQRARAKQLAQVRSSVTAGARVITTAGLYARVAEVGADETLLLEIAPGVQARFAAQAVVRVLDEPADESSDDDDAAGRDDAAASPP